MSAATTLERFGAGYLRVRSLVDAAEVAQWQAPPTVRPRDDPGGRQIGVTSDPTVRAALDGRRLRLRARVVEAEHALALAGRQLSAAERNLSDALGDWNGD